MRKIPFVLLPMFALFLFQPVESALAAAKEARSVESAAEVLETIEAIPERGIPPALLGDAWGVAVFPGLIKAGLVVGGQYGHGVLSVREKGGGWSDPVFVTLASGSAGFQIGAESTDLVLVFKTHRSVQGIMRGKYTLGADVAVAAGPVGRLAEAATDIQLKAEIYSYSRNRGLFAGVSLEGASLQIDDRSNAAFYEKRGIGPSEILAGKGFKTPQGAERLIQDLDRYAAGPARK
jgi:lipid-binding SYLF domain-containing protein